MFSCHWDVDVQRTCLAFGFKNTLFFLDFQLLLFGFVEEKKKEKKAFLLLCAHI